MGYAANSTGYCNGDFDYSGRVDADDYFLIDSNYNKSQTALPPLASVPASAHPLSRRVDFEVGDFSAYRRLLDDPETASLT